MKSHARSSQLFICIYLVVATKFASAADLMPEWPRQRPDIAGLVRLFERECERIGGKENWDRLVTLKCWQKDAAGAVALAKSGKTSAAAMRYAFSYDASERGVLYEPHPDWPLPVKNDLYASQARLLLERGKPDEALEMATHLDPTHYVDPNPRTIPFDEWQPFVLALWDGGRRDTAHQQIKVTVAAVDALPDAKARRYYAVNCFASLLIQLGRRRSSALRELLPFYQSIAVEPVIDERYRRDTVAVWGLLAELHHGLGNETASRAALRSAAEAATSYVPNVGDAIKLDQQRFALVSSLSLVAFRAQNCGQTEFAKQTARQILEIAPGIADLNLQAAGFQYGIGRLLPVQSEEAQRMVNAQPAGSLNRIKGLEALAEQEQKGKRWGRAREYLLVAYKESDPSLRSGSVQSLINLEIEAGRPEEARKYALERMRDWPDTRRYRYNRIWTCWEARMLDEAYEFLSKGTDRERIDWLWSFIAWQHIAARKLKAE